MGNSFCSYVSREQSRGDLNTAASNPKDLNLVVHIAKDFLLSSPNNDDIRAIAKHNCQLHAVTHVDAPGLDPSSKTPNGASEKDTNPPPPKSGFTLLRPRPTRNCGVVVATTCSEITVSEGRNVFKSPAGCANITRSIVESSARRKESDEISDTPKAGDEEGKKMDPLEGKGPASDNPSACSPVKEKSCRKPSSPDDGMWSLFDGSLPPNVRLSLRPTGCPSSCEKAARSMHSVATRSGGHIFFKGNLLKYHPGFSSPYIVKHCRIARAGFMYGVSQCKFDANVPLTAINYEDMERACRVDVPLPGKRGARTKRLFQFEVFMRPGRELCKSRVRNVFLLHPHSGSGRNNKLEDKSRNQLDRAYTVEGHLMVRPKSLAKYSSSLNKPKTGSDKSAQPPIQKISVDNVLFESEEEALGYVEFVRLNGSSLLAVKQTETRSPQKGVSSWNSRELEWYCAEERLLFASESMEECETWVWALNWMISQRKKDK